MPLTPRQQQIVPMVADGLTYREIGIRLGIAPGTVRQHITLLVNRLPHPHLRPKDRIVRYHIGRDAG